MDDSRWLATTLAVPREPLHPDVPCAEVHAMMAQDETQFAAAVVEDGVPIGLAERNSLMAQFARLYWREVFSRRPITALMDHAPVVVDVSAPIEVVGHRIATEKRAVLNSGFIVTCEGRYLGVGSTVELLRLIAEHAGERTQELGFAYQHINTLNQTLERRIEERTADLRSAHEQLVLKERLSALGQLTATVAHELRNPLGTIRNTLHAIKLSPAAGEPHLSRPLERMERGVVRCDRIIANLLDFTRVRELKLTTTAADAWLAGALAEQRPGDGIALVQKLGAPGCRLRCDTERMRQVVVNLIENAAQAIAQADPAPRQRLITVGTDMRDGDYVVTIADTGPGIPADVLPKVFEPLFSTKSFGTGLGLPLVKQILAQHGGAIAIASEPGNGTRVTLRLPCAVAAQDAA
ncbi:MAG TPA: ATP-binding protein [Stellaceae bacterium]|nr:ATP-binding protein [Stellaceae bacterium]